MPSIQDKGKQAMSSTNQPAPEHEEPETIKSLLEYATERAMGAKTEHPVDAVGYLAQSVLAVIDAMKIACAAPIVRYPEGPNKPTAEQVEDLVKHIKNADTIKLPSSTPTRAIIIYGQGTLGSLLPKDLTGNQFDEFNDNMAAAVKAGKVEFL